MKLGEVFSVLRERFELPESLDIPREQTSTIGGVTDALRQYLSISGDANGSSLDRVEEDLRAAEPGGVPIASGAVRSASANESDLADPDSRSKKSEMRL